MLGFSFVLLLGFSFVLFASHASVSLLSPLVLGPLLSDPSSLFIVYMLIVVFYTSFLISPVSQAPVLLLLFLSCLGFFCTDSYLVMYVSYEASIVPIFYIIVKIGAYPDRSLSALMLLAYTSFFSLPFLYFIYYIWCFNSTFSLTLTSYANLFPSMSLFTVFFVFIVFAVKLPIYGIHLWLPIAHVEAPTFGSMLLAGVLLKLGGVGLMRFSALVNFSVLSSVLLSYLIVFLVVSALVCCFQSDFNRLVAYSSVTHMISIPFLALASTPFSNSASLLLMFFHALSSPLLFMLVGVVYSMCSSRQLLLVRGISLLSPLLSFLLVLSFFFTLSAPPFPSFISEVFFFYSAYFLSPWFIVSIFLFSFISLVYNLNWLSSILFSSPLPSSCSFSLSYLVVLISFIYVGLGVLSLFLVPFF